MNQMNGFATHYGHWGWAVILIVVVSWVLYRFAAPKGWREWAGAGLVQAFIIALYAEMYGFPLTIYLLVGFFGIDLPLYVQSGHLWASLLGYGMVGATIEMLLGGVFVIVGLMLLIAGWREVFDARREGRMASNGIYGLVRHPQYSGILLAGLGSDRALANATYCSAVSRHRLRLCAAGAQGGEGHAGAFRCGVSGLHAAGADVFPAPRDWGRLLSAIASPFSK